MEESLDCTSLTFKSNHDDKLLPILYSDLLYDQMYCDANICVDEHVFVVHRVVLAAHSKFFDNKFKSQVSTQRLDNGNFVMDLFGIDWLTAWTVIDYLYTSSVTITSDNVYDLLFAADNFKLTELKEFCMEFLETFLCSDNCLSIMKNAISFEIPMLIKKAKAILYENISYVIETTDFKQLTLDDFVEFVMPKERSSIKICESLIYEALMVWVNHDGERAKNFADLFKQIKLNQLKLSFLVNTVAKEEHVKSSFICLQLLNKAYESYYDEDHNIQLDLKQLTTKEIVQQREKIIGFLHEDSIREYVVNSKWINRWLKYVTNDGYEWTTEMRTQPHPGPIDNTPLFKNQYYKNLRSNLMQQLDYSFLPEKAWLALVACYGTIPGQPCITKKSLANERVGILIDIDDMYIADPIELRLRQLSDPRKIVIREFSKLDLIMEVEKEMSKIFNLLPLIAHDILVGGKVVDKKKTIKECNLTNMGIIVIDDCTSKPRDVLEKTKSEKNSETSGEA